MEITIGLQEYEVAFIDAIAHYTSGDRPSAVALALGALFEEINENGPAALTTFAQPHAAAAWRQITFLAAA